LPKNALTAAAVARIKLPKRGQDDHFDKGYPGLALRLSYGGARTWVYVFRLHGKLRRMTLGRYPSMSLAQAREAWRDARTLIAKGENPARARPATADSFAAITEDWLKRDQASNRSATEVRRAIERDVMPAWRDRLIASITRRDVIELIDAVADRGAVAMARQLHTYLHRLFRWSVGRGVIETNPMTDLPKLGAAVKRDRALTDDELRAVWIAADEIGWPFGRVTKLLILTGARREEVAALQWTEINGDKIELSGQRTKNGEPHMIPLTHPALDIISTLPRIAGSKFVFTTTGKSPVSGWSRAKAALDAKAQIPAWRLHDLRRTCATGLQRLGASLQVIEAVLGHLSGSRSGVVGVYQRHSFDAEKRAALDAWAREVERIVRGD
jgi:integrase